MSDDRPGIPQGYRSEKQQGAIMGLSIATLRSMATRRTGPPRVKRGRQILYRKQAYDQWLLKREVDFDDMRAGATTS